VERTYHIMKQEFITRKTLLMRASDPNDHEAWEDFVYYYEDFLSLVFKRFLLSRSDCEDLKQEILVTLWQKLTDYDEGKAQFRTWLTRIIRNAVINRIKKNSNKKKLANDEVIDVLKPYNSDDFDNLIQEEWEAYAATLALERIKPLFTENAIQVFQMTLDNLNGHEISEHLNISVDSVYKMKNRVIRRLQEEIKLIRLETEF